MAQNPFSLEDKTILITGASSGIGRATAIIATQMGAKVVLSGRNSERLHQTLSMIQGEGHVALLCDLTDNAQMTEMVDQLQKLDGVVYCAGTQETCITRMLTHEMVMRLMDTNFMSVASLNAMLLSKKKISKGASVVLVSSAAATRVAEAGNAAYSASKGALSAFGRVLAVELAPRGIRVNMVAPAMVKTAIMEKFDVSSEEFMEDEKRYLLGYGEPEDVANTIAFLLSDASKWMTGSELILDGGLTLH